MIEILVVLTIIVVLLSAVLVASSTLVNKSKVTNTQAVLQIVSDALAEFQREQTANPTITRNLRYKDRYGLYPPDELEVFSNDAGVPGGATKTGSLAPNKASIAPSLPYKAIRFYRDASADDAKEHRDLAAMIVAIETLGDASRSMLDRIPDRSRTPGILAADGKPAQFLNRDANAAWGPADLQIRFIVDDWGNPLSYMSQQDWTKEAAEKHNSSNHEAWNEASTELIRLNGGQPVVFSWGPNGKDQLTKLAMEPAAGAVAVASLVGDFEQNDDHVVNNPLNDDNVYANPSLKEKLAKGIGK